MISLLKNISKQTSSEIRWRLQLLLTLAILLPALAQAQVAITTTALPVARTGSIYSTTLSASGGSGTYVWQLANGSSLPAGFTLDANTGIISGVPSAASSGTPPLPTAFQVQVADTTLPAPYTATSSFAITAIPAGSHALVINQLFTGGNSSASSPYANNLLEVFNAAPVAIDLQNWTIQIAGATSKFSTAGIYPLGSLDAYSLGTTGGLDGAGNYPAYQITYSAAFTSSNCNAAAGGSQINTAFPPSHCWLNPGQFLLVLLGTTSSTGALKTLPQISADLDLTAGYINGTLNSSDTGAGVTLNNVGPVAGTGIWVGHGVTATNENTYIAKTNPSNGMLALVNGVNVGPNCPTLTTAQVNAGSIANPMPAASYWSSTSDFISYIAQLTAGGQTPPICWEGATANGYATHVSSSGKNTQALIRSAGNGKINTAVTGAQAPAGTLLPSSATLTPCGDSDNNLSDFAPIAIGVNGGLNWTLHNSQQILTKASATTLNAPVAYSPAACSGVAAGPTVSAVFSAPVVPQNAGGGTYTETLTVTVTPSSYPTAELFSVSAPVSSIPGAALVGAPISNSSIGIPDKNGNLTFSEQVSIPTGTETTFSLPVTVMDDAGRWAVNASRTTPLAVQVTVGSPCAAPTAANQSVAMSWNNAQSISIGGTVGLNCTSTDTLVYAIQNAPLHGVLSAVSGNNVLYTPTAGFAGRDSFTFNVTDTTNSAGSLTSTLATVSITVSATGVPTLTLNCPPSPVYSGLPQSCGATLLPYVAGTTTLTYSGSSVAPVAAGNYTVLAAFTADAGASQNTSASTSMTIAPATPTVKLNCPMVAYNGTAQSCTASVTGIGGSTPSGTLSLSYNGSTTAPTNEGQYNVVASFSSADTNYASTSASATLNIYKPQITITAVSQTVAYGGTMPALTYTISPSVPLDQAPLCVASESATSAVGSYNGVITCSGAAKSGSTITYVAGNLTVQPGAATITANDQTMYFGASLPSLGYRVSPAGIALSTAPTCSTTVTSNSPVGKYAITCAGASNANYTFSYVVGNLTVQAAPATITANDQTMLYGSGAPVLSYSVTPAGIAFSTAPACSTVANAASPVGNYPVVCAGAVNAGYAFTYVTGKIVVQPAPATVTADNQTMVAGANVPTLTYTTSPAGVSFSVAPSCSTTATSASPYGSYPITCSGGAAANYALSYAAGTLNVSFAPIVPNSIPTLTSISPMNVTAGGNGLTLTVNGKNFVKGATVLWNGAALTTTYLSATQLTAVVPAASVAPVGEDAITVVNPAPGGGTSVVTLAFSVDTAPLAPGGFSFAAVQTTLNVTHGQSAVTQLTFTGLDASAMATVVCYNLPAQATCDYNAANGALTVLTSSATPAGSYSVLVVTSTGKRQTAMTARTVTTALCGVLGFPLGLLLLFRGRKLRLYALALVALLLASGLVACGGSTANSSTLINAQSSTIVTLNVQ